MVMFNNSEKKPMTNAKVTGMETERRKRRMTVDNFYAIPRNPPSASSLPIFDESHIRNAMARFSQTRMNPGERRKAFNKIVRAASKHGINSSRFKSKYERRLSESDDISREDTGSEKEEKLKGIISEEIKTDMFSI